MLGRESAGVPDEVFAAADERLVIPMQGGHALAQCRDGGGDGARRSIEANRGGKRDADVS